MLSEKEGERLQRTESGRRMATSSSGGGGPSCVLVAGPGGEDITSPIFGVKDAPTLALADTLAAARVSHAAQPRPTFALTLARVQFCCLVN